MSQGLQEVKQEKSEVSTGKVENQNPAISSENGTTNGVTAAVRLTGDTDAIVVTVDQLDPDYFPNPRQHRGEKDVVDMMHSLKDEGQLQPVVGAMVEGVLRVVAGYTRTEAFNRNVYNPLILKWNKENSLSGENALMVSNPKHRAMMARAYPDDFDREKKKPANMIRVTLKTDVTTKAQAFAKAVAENEIRNNMVLFDRIAAMVHMTDVLHQKGKDVAGVFRISEAQISNFKRVWRMKDLLVETMTTPEPGETFAESDLVKVKEAARELHEALIGRMKTLPDQEIHVSISHLKELAARVLTKDDEKRPLTRGQIMEAVCHLVGANEKTFKIIGQDAGKERNPFGDKAPMNFGAFVTWLKDAAEETKARREGKVPAKEQAAADAATAAAKQATDAAAGSQTGTVEGLAAQQQAAVSTGKTGVAGSAEVAAALATDADAEAEAAEANADVSLTDKAASLVGADAKAVKEAAGDDEEVQAGTNRRIQQAPISRAKLKELDVIHSAVLTLVSMAQEEESEDTEVSLASIAANLAAASFGYDMLNLAPERKIVDGVLAEYSSAMDDYVGALEDYCEEAQKKAKGMKPFALERPTCPVLEGLVSDAGDKDDDDVVDDDDEEELPEGQDDSEEPEGSDDEGDDEDDDEGEGDE